MVKLDIGEVRVPPLMLTRHPVQPGVTGLGVVRLVYTERADHTAERRRHLPGPLTPVTERMVPGRPRVRVRAESPPASADVAVHEPCQQLRERRRHRPNRLTRVVINVVAALPLAIHAHPAAARLPLPLTRRALDATER